MDHHIRTHGTNATFANGLVRNTILPSKWGFDHPPLVTVITHHSLGTWHMTHSNRFLPLMRWKKVACIPLAGIDPVSDVTTFSRRCSCYHGNGGTQERLNETRRQETGDRRQSTAVHTWAPNDRPERIDQWKYVTNMCIVYSIFW
jgi:hypothetical protein